MKRLYALVKKYKVLLFILFLLVTAFFFFKDYEAKGSEYYYEKCSGAKQQEKVDCWEEGFGAILKKRGVKEGFNFLVKLYRNEPDFAEDCHDYTHLIGEAAYRNFAGDGEFDVVPETSYCGYGFYHGFIIEMMKKEGTLKESSDFCTYVSNTLSNVAPGIALDCYHGIGHGVTDYALEGIPEGVNPQELIDSSLDLCKKVARDDAELYRCADGVYHGLTEVNLDSPFIDREDPFRLCRRQPEEFRKVCYGSLGFLLMEFNDNDFSKSTEVAISTPKKEYSMALIRQLSGYQGYRVVGNDSFDNEILVCRGLGAVFSKECFKGIIEGLTDFGEPGEEHLKTLSFCESEIMSEEERDFCYTHAAGYIRRYLGDDRGDLVCEMIEDKYCS